MRRVAGELRVEDELALALGQDAAQLLVEDHLRELLLHLGDGQADELRDASDLDARERLDDAPEVLLEDAVVQ